MCATRDPLPEVGFGQMSGKVRRVGRDGTFGCLIGKLDVLRIECAQCNRAGRYGVAKLVAECGPDAKLTIG
jgi:hypothetical protein